MSTPLTIATLALAIAQPLAGLGFMVAVGRLVGQIPTAFGLGLDTVLDELGWLTAIYVAQHVAGVAIQVTSPALGRRLAAHLEEHLMTGLLTPTGLAHVEDPRIRDLVSEATGRLGAGRWRPEDLPPALASLISGALALALAAGVVIWLQWWLGLLLLGASVWTISELREHVWRMALRLLEERGAGAYRRIDYEYDAAVASWSAKEVRLFGFGPWLLARVEESHIRLLGLRLSGMARTRVAEVAAILTLLAVVGGGFVWAGVQAGRGTLSLAGATVLVQALLAPLTHKGMLLQSLLDIQQSIRPIPALREIEHHVRQDPVTVGIPVPADVPATSIRMENVSFAYPETGVGVLHELDLEIPVGSSMAVVGLNGAGKTTLVKLLAGFYDPTAGSIYLDRTDLTEFDRASWQRRVAAIFQDFAHYPMSAEDNVRVGSLSADDHELGAAIERAGAAEVLRELPGGWDTPLTRDVDQGTELSGGQWQRIALARALLAADRSTALLVLDEPAANLDVRAEAQLNERFLELTRGLTTIVISHRFSTVRMAHRICVLDHGRLIELGTHDELIAAAGRYAELFRLQAARFTR